MVYTFQQEIYSFVEIEAISINHQPKHIEHTANLHFRFQIEH